MFRPLIETLAGLSPEPGIWILREFRTGVVSAETGCARVTVENGRIVARGAFRDYDIYSDATADNQELWRLGDTFELIFGEENRRDYFEVQVAPNGTQLELHIPDCRTFRSISHFRKVCDIGLQSRAIVLPEQNLWLAELRIPLRTVGIRDDHLRFVAVRQNHTHGRATEISASAVFPETAHTPTLWNRLPVCCAPHLLAKCAL